MDLDLSKYKATLSCKKYSHFSILHPKSHVSYTLLTKEA